MKVKQEEGRQMAARRKLKPRARAKEKKGRKANQRQTTL